MSSRLDRERTNSTATRDSTDTLSGKAGISSSDEAEMPRLSSQLSEDREETEESMGEELAAL